MAKVGGGMAFRLKSSDRDIAAALRRIAREQTRAILAQTGGPLPDRHRLVHEMRKRCKKLRALLRLVAPVLDDTKAADAAVRDAARLLSPVRDAQVLVETLDHVLAGFAGEVDEDDYRRLRDHLIVRRDALTGREPGIDGALAAFRAHIAAFQKQIGRWTLAEDGFAAVAPGLKANYARARKAMRAAQAAPTAENLHDWRKQVKYHQAHIQLLRPIWPALLSTRQAHCSDLGDVLGADHDLAVFQALLESEGAEWVGKAAISRIGLLAGRRRAALARQAWPMGARLFAEKPAAFTRRWHAYWRAAGGGGKGLFR